MSKRFKVGDTCGVFDLESNDHEYCLNDIEVCDLLNNQTERISDLETKLAESEKEHEKCNTEWTEICDGKLETINRLIEEKHQLKYQLAEKEESIKYLKGIKRYDIGKMLIENKKLKHQLEESERLIERLKQIIDKLRDKKFAGETLVNAVNSVYEPLYQNKCDEVEELKKQLHFEEQGHDLSIQYFEEETNKLRKQIKFESDARKRFVEEVKNLKQQLEEKGE